MRHLSQRETPADTDLSKFVLKIWEKSAFYVQTTADILKEIISSRACGDKKKEEDISDSQQWHPHVCLADIYSGG